MPRNAVRRFRSWRERRMRRHWERKGPGWYEARMFRHPTATAVVIVGLAYGPRAVYGPERWMALVAGLVLVPLLRGTFRAQAAVFDRWRAEQADRGVEVVTPRRPRAGEAVAIAVAVVAYGFTAALAVHSSEHACTGDLDVVPVPSQGAVHALWHVTCSDSAGHTSVTTAWQTGPEADGLDPWADREHVDRRTCVRETDCSLVAEIPLRPGQCVVVESVVHAYRGGALRSDWSADRATDELCLPA